MWLHLTERTCEPGMVFLYSGKRCSGTMIVMGQWGRKNLQFRNEMEVSCWGVPQRVIIPSLNICKFLQKLHPTHNQYVDDPETLMDLQ